MSALKKTEKHDIDVVIGRLKVRLDLKQRLAEIFEAALRLAGGRAIALEIDYKNDSGLRTIKASSSPIDQRWIKSVQDMESITVDWEVGAACVKTHHGIANVAQKTSKCVVTTGCGQDSVFGGLMDTVVIKSAQMGRTVAQRAIDRATHTVFLCYSAAPAVTVMISNIPHHESIL